MATRYGTERAVTRMTESPATYGDFLIRGTNKWENANFENEVVAIVDTMFSFGDELQVYSTDAETAPYTGIDNMSPGSIYAQVTDLNQLRAAYDNLRRAYDDLRSLLVAQGIVSEP